MSRSRRRLIGFLSAAVVVCTLAFGARELLASSRMASCEDCDETTNCTQCCIDWQAGTFGICPMGGGYCLCG
jgi:hypothetical protein